VGLSYVFRERFFFAAFCVTLLCAPSETERLNLPDVLTMAALKKFARSLLKAPFPASAKKGRPAQRESWRSVRFILRTFTRIIDQVPWSSEKAPGALRIHPLSPSRLLWSKSLLRKMRVPSLSFESPPIKLRLPSSPPPFRLFPVPVANFRGDAARPPIRSVKRRPLETAEWPFDLLPPKIALLIKLGPLSAGALVQAPSPCTLIGVESRLCPPMMDVYERRIASPPSIVSASIVPALPSFETFCGSPSSLFFLLWC